MTHRRNLLLLLLLVAIPAAAQEPVRTDKVDIEKQLLPELSQFAVSYWVPRLNGYKVSIDRSISMSDLATLDALRIRWGILIADVQKSGYEDVVEADARYNGTEQPVPAYASEEPNPTPVPTESATVSVGVGGTVTAAPETFEPAPRNETSPEDLFESAQRLAAGNRSQMSTIHDLIIVDLNTFIDRGIELVDRFFEQNRAGISPRDAREWSEFRESMASPEARDKVITEFDMLYNQGGEAFVMLYNGEDVLRLLGLALPASAPLSDMNIAQSSMLAQNIPNPAGSTTQIGYTLREASSRTSIEIFDASGTRMLTLDQGSRSPGEHSAIVDLSKLSTGTYLYRLTVQTGHGEQVSSRVMQVVR